MEIIKASCTIYIQDKFLAKIKPDTNYFQNNAFP